MTVTINGTSGVTTPSLTSEGAITGDGISFADNAPSNSLVVNSSGNVGIGTSSPSSKLTINNASAADYAVFQTGGATKGVLGDESGNFIIKSASAMLMQTNGSERMRIDSSGNVGIGYTSISQKLAVKANDQATALYLGNGPTNGYHAMVIDNPSTNHYAVLFKDSSNNVGSIITTSTSTSYNTSSDYRLKENIQPMQNALGVVQQLNPVTYTWKSDGSDGQGFIAHELQSVVPDCVTGEKDAVDAEGNPVYQGIDTSFLAATLTKAIQELSAKVDAQQAEIDALKGVSA